MSLISLTRSLPQFVRPPINNVHYGTRPFGRMTRGGRPSVNVAGVTATGARPRDDNAIVVGSRTPRSSYNIRPSDGFAAVAWGMPWRQQRSAISTTPPARVIGWIQEKLTERAVNKKAAKLVDQISLMANTPVWTIKMFADEIDETLSSWQTKIPGAARTTELQAARDTQEVVRAMLDHLGEGVTPEDIKRLDRKKKLKLVIACKRPMDEVDRVLQSFNQMSIMHRILRYRKENGIPLPSDEDGLKMAMQSDGMKVMTKEEKEEMREVYGKHALAKASGKTTRRA